MNDVTCYSVDYLNRLLASVSAFEQAFNAWMETQHESDHVQSRGLMPTVWVRDGVNDAEVRIRELEVAETAGAAARAVAVTGAYVAVEGLGTVDPISNWSGMRNPKTFLSPQDIRLSVATVKGRL